MSGTASQQTGVGKGIPGQTRSTAPRQTGWVGWIFFAAVMMIMIGSLHVIEGLVAIFNDKYYLVSDRGLVVTVDYTAWGWVHLIGGLIVAGAGVALFSGRLWARVVAVLVACVSIIINFGFVGAYPVWSGILIALDVFVLYALLVHGREMAA